MRRPHFSSIVCVVFFVMCAPSSDDFTSHDTLCKALTACIGDDKVETLFGDDVTRPLGDVCINSTYLSYRDSVTDTGCNDALDAYEKCALIFGQCVENDSCGNPFDELGCALISVTKVWIRPMMPKHLSATDL